MKVFADKLTDKRMGKLFAPNLSMQGHKISTGFSNPDMFHVYILYGSLARTGSVVRSGSLTPWEFSAITLNSYSSPGSRLRTSQLGEDKKLLTYFQHKTIQIV